MTIPRSVADVLTTHTLFDVECIDRMYLNVYVPGLQYAPGLVAYVHRQLGLPVASTAPLARITDRFAAAVHRFADTGHIPWVDFAKGQRKDDVMHEYLEQFTAPEGVVFIGRAQERTPLFRTEKRRDADGKSYPWIVKSTGVVNHYYFYCVDADFGPFFLKFCSYFPYNAKLCINGHHWAQRQAARAGLGFTALDNAFAAVDDPDALQAICDRLTGPRIDALLRKWLAILPDPFTDADRDAGYRYDLSVLQAEFSLTQMLDAPVSGRVFFEQVIRDNLDLGRPDQVTLVFDRRLMRRGPRATPGRFRTRVITEGVTPSLHVDYKHTTIKQYHKEGRALRTETTINDTRDFHLGKRLTHLPALREIGFHANRRLLRVQRLSHDPIIGADALAAITAPVITTTGTRVPGLRFADQRSHALLSALLVFRLHPNGFTNKDLRTLTGELRGLDPDEVSAGQMTYDLRRLKTRSLIVRIEGTHRYQVTDLGLDTAKFLTCIHDRVLRTGLAELAAPTTTPGRLRSAATAYRTAVDTLTATAQLAA
ncbi:hypothetical protein [Rhodococcus koreensis]|uniref:hypothetical protein n=1 Tax=Rhodococcus koreensis TaxID=99653 RepID=UPI00197E314E|nr:hypothetical protein [Rhodococcus koreensis]QSE78215.1 hypothetical protein JWS14_03120 [Rhodococcus koreensis]QSE84642.1 hypothetical protein JWS14_38770 [Rhodococcus koreensis]QSE85560.1 hypothetical protein JWS14_41070 [Rhodococcus koreensis]QSE86440.1 hypothetical protein JWS14_46545 [Rhodococcus koreensis]